MSSVYSSQQACSGMFTYLVANSTPMVLLLSKLNSLRVNRDSRLLFPTPESPINTTENDQSNACYKYMNIITGAHCTWISRDTCKPKTEVIMQVLTLPIFQKFDRILIFRRSAMFLCINGRCWLYIMPLLQYNILLTFPNKIILVVLISDRSTPRTVTIHDCCLVFAVVTVKGVRYLYPGHREIRALFSN